MNLVLISRSEAKLSKVSREIQLDTGVQIKLIVADFSKGDSIYERIGKELEPVDVGILGALCCACLADVHLSIYFRHFQLTMLVWLRIV